LLNSAKAPTPAPLVGDVPVVTMAAERPMVISPPPTGVIVSLTTVGAAGVGATGLLESSITPRVQLTSIAPPKITPANLNRKGTKLRSSQSVPSAATAGPALTLTS
jgi:hypothetical protein